MNDYKILGAEFGLGAKLHETQKGPKAIFELLPAQLAKKFEFIKPDDYKVGKGRENLVAIRDFCEKLALIVKKDLIEGKFPIVMGGDHSIAIGTWSGIMSALNAYQNFGLLWVDAHMDSHTYETSTSKAYHGMPLAALLGYGDKDMTDLIDSTYKLNPAHVVIFGARSFEDEEHELLKRLGVKIFYANEIHSKGLKECLTQAFSIVSKARAGYGITIDLDFFDPIFAPGVGSPERNGFNPKEFIEALNLLKITNLKGLEIVELNPDLDIDNKTALISIRLIQSFLENFAMF